MLQLSIFCLFQFSMGKKRPIKKPGLDLSLEPSHWESLTKENSFFVQYYKEQRIITHEEEWDVFIGILKQMLPLSYRFVAFHGKNLVLFRRMMHDFISKLPESLPRPYHLSWYPGSLSVQHDISRTEIRL